MQPETWTLLRLLQWTTDYLKQHGSESPRLEAEVLLAHARGCRRIDLYTAFDAEADDALRTKFRELVRRRAEGTPVAYLVGHKEFYSLDFTVSPAVLIPRPETELLVVALLDRAKEIHAAGGEPTIRIADVGTGSGVISICAAKNLPQANIVAIDQSPEALALARQNASRHGVEARIDFIEGDLLSPLPPEPTFDFIVSNPPYVSREEFEKLPRDVREHEPRQALVGGETGTEIIARLIPQAAERLRSGGWLMLEISPMIERPTRDLVIASGQFEPPTTMPDLARLPRVVLARRR